MTTHAMMIKVNPLNMRPMYVKAYMPKVKSNFYDSFTEVDIIKMVQEAQNAICVNANLFSAVAL